MKVLIGCEFSGIVRDAFFQKGHDAWSCDLLLSETKGQHLVTDVRKILNWNWDMAIFFPPCTHLCVSGARWFKNKKEQQKHALEFVKCLIDADIPKICIENPVGIISTRIRKPDQIIQPWQFGHPETKKTCLWLKGLPLLQSTNIVDGRNHSIHKEPPGPDRWKNRSRTFTGIAKAMSEQWG